MTPPRKQPKRARRMWAIGNKHLVTIAPDRESARDEKHWRRGGGTIDGGNVDIWPVCVIPTDAASVEEMVERAAQVLCLKEALYPLDYCTEHFPKFAESSREKARLVIRDLLGLKGRK